MKKIKRLFLVILLLVLIFVFIQSIQKDSGNGNLSNMGLATEEKGTIYYNKYEKGIFSLKDGKEKQLTAEKSFSIQVINNKIYYLSIENFSNVVVKVVDVTGENLKKLLTINTSISKIYVDDKSIYFYEIGSKKGLYKVDLEGQNKQQILEENVQDFALQGKYIYYINNDKQICKMDTSGQNAVVLQESIYARKLQVTEKWIYYFNETENALFRLKTNGKSNELVSILVNNETYNVYNGYVYYFDKENLKISRMNLKKTNRCDVVTDVQVNSTKINIVGDQLYYLDKSQDESQTYQIFRKKLNGEETEQIKYE